MAPGEGSLERKNNISRRNFLKAVGAGVALSAVPVANALGDVSKTSVEVSANLEEFSRRFAALRNPLAALKEGVDDGITMSQRMRPEKALEVVQALLRKASQFLALVADNSEISKFGSEALQQAQQQKEKLRNDVRFKLEERQSLVAAWEARIKVTQRKIDQIEKMRTRALNITTVLQSRESIVDEWIALKQTEVESPVLTNDLVQAFANLDDLLGHF